MPFVDMTVYPNTRIPLNPLPRETFFHLIPVGPSPNYEAMAKQAAEEMRKFIERHQIPAMRAEEV